MYKFLVLSIVVLHSLSLEAKIGCKLQTQTQTQTQEGQGALFQMDTVTYNFGDVSRKGGDVKKDFSYVNSGDSPLVVTRVSTSCSCTKIEFSKRPLYPKKGGKIGIIYDPRKEALGSFNKVIHIFSNSADGKHIITVRGRVVE